MHVCVRFYSVCFAWKNGNSLNSICALNYTTNITYENKRMWAVMWNYYTENQIKSSSSSSLSVEHFVNEYHTHNSSLVRCLIEESFFPFLFRNFQYKNDSWLFFKFISIEIIYSPNEITFTAYFVYKILENAFFNHYEWVNMPV